MMEDDVGREKRGSSDMGPSAADARAPTPRMVNLGGGVSSSHIVAPTPQQALFNPYVLGATAAAAQYPAFAAAAAAAGQSPLLLAAAAAVRNPAQIGLANQLLLNPSAAALAAIQQYQNPYLLNSVAINGLSPSLAAFYYSQQVQAAAAAQGGGMASPIVGASQAQQMPQGGVSLAVSTSLTPGFAQSHSPVVSTEFRNTPYIAPSARRAELVASANSMNLARRQSAPILDVGGARMVAGGSPGESSWKTHMERNGRLSTSSHSAVENSGNGGPKPMLSSPEAIQEHISRLISENEAIVEPMPPILNKRRSYRHQNCLTPTQQGPGEHPKSSPHQSRAFRSHSLVEGALLRQGNFPQVANLMGPLQPTPHEMKLGRDIESAQSTLPTSPSSKQSGQNFECRFCTVEFSNEKSLDAHVFRCIHNPRQGNQKPGSSSSDMPGQTAETMSSTSNEGDSGASSEVSPGQLSASPPPKISSRFNDQMKTGNLNHEWRNHPLKKRILAAAADDAATEASAPKVPKLEPPSPPRMAAKPPLTRAATHSVVFPDSIGREGAFRPGIPSNISRAAAPSVVEARDSSLEPKLLQHGNSGFPASGKFITGPAPPLPTAQFPVLFPQVSISSLERTRNFSPYCVTVQVPGAQSFEAPRSGRRPRHVTAPTFVCLKRPQPMSLPHTEPKLSMYSTWQQAPVNPMEAKLNVLWMSGCCTRPQRGSPFWKYTVATEQLSVPRMTHSSFWEISKKAQEQKPQGAESTEEGEKSLTSSEEQAVLAGKKLSIATQTTNTISHSSVISSEKNLRNGDSESDSKDQKKSSEGETAAADAEPKLTAGNPPEEGRDDKRSIKEKLRGAILNPRVRSPRKPRWERVFNGGIRTNEKYTYVRGRGKGRYVCEKCGIRCRKQSMLLKHIKSHLNVRPFSCTACSFSFKTKGNLTKHLKSKAHRNKASPLRKRTSSRQNTETMETDYDSDDNRLEIDSTAGSTTESADEEEDGEMGQKYGEVLEDDDENILLRHLQPQYYWLPNRSSHTPPAQAPELDYNDRNCDSLPPHFHLCPSDSLDSGKNETRCLDSAIQGNKDSRESKENGVAKLGAQKQVTEPGWNQGLTNHYLMPSKGSVKCDQCDKEFPDQGKLRVHTHVHNYEQSRSSRRNNYSCPSCSIQMRTKAQLQKHIETRHGTEKEASGVETDPTSAGPCLGGLDQNSPKKRPINGETSIKSPASRNPGPSALGPSNPRPFYCQDCDKGFRIHGHLAKHLRSKQHITHLEMLEKLPLGFYAALEASKGINLAEDLDTSDCETCLAGLRDLSAKITPSDGSALRTEKKEDELEAERAKSSVASHPPTTTVPHASPVPVSLACTEHMLPSPSPPPVVSSPPTQRAQSPDVDAQAPAENGADTTPTQKSVIADVWVPPRETDIPIQNAAKKAAECYERNATEKLLDEGRPNDGSRAMSPKENEVEDVPGTEENGAVDASGDQSCCCPFCKLEFSTRPELDIHLHSDHIQMRDGKDFKCPRANCDKVFPSKESLKIHITAHFNGHSAPATNGGNGTFERDGDVSRETMAALQRKLSGVGGAQGPSNVSVPALTVGNQSPGTPEESQTSIAAINGGRKKMKTHLVSLNSIPEASGAGVSASSSGDFKSPGSMGGNNSPGSETSEVPSRASSSHSASPLPAMGLLVGGPATLGKPLNKRKSVENDCNGLGSPIGVSAQNLRRISSPDGRRCISASEHSPRTNYPPSFFSPSDSRLQNSASSSMSLPAVPAQLRLAGSTDSHQAALAWMAQGIAPGFLPPHFLYGQNSFSAPNNTPMSLNEKLMLSSMIPAPQPELNGSTSLHSQDTRGSVQTPSSNGRLSSVDAPAAAAPGVVCPVCSKTLPPSTALQDHLMLHIQSRPHVCEHCDAGFTTANGLKSHMLSHQQQPQPSES